MNPEIDLAEVQNSVTMYEITRVYLSLLVNRELREMTQENSVTGLMPTKVAIDNSTSKKRRQKNQPFQRTSHTEHLYRSSLQHTALLKVKSR